MPRPAICSRITGRGRGFFMHRGGDCGDREICESARVDDAIAACTRLIDDGRAQGTALGQLYYKRGAAYLAKYQRVPGLADIDRAIELKPDLAEAYIARARANGFNNHDKERLKRVLADYTKAIDLKPDNYEAFYYRGTFNDWQKSYDAALADYNRALEIKPDDIKTLHMRSRLYQHIGEYERALADCEALVRLDPSEERLLHRGAAYVAVGDYERALADYDAYERRKPGGPSIHSGRAAAFEAKGDYERALSEYNEAPHCSECRWPILGARLDVLQAGQVRRGFGRCGPSLGRRLEE